MYRQADPEKHAKQQQPEVLLFKKLTYLRSCHLFARFKTAFRKNTIKIRRDVPKIQSEKTQKPTENTCFG